MNEFNLKKKNMRREAHFDKSNLLTKNGSDLIANKFKFISKKLDNYLILDEDIILDLFDKKRKHSGSKIKSGFKVKLSLRNFFDFSKFSSKLEPTVI